MENKQQNKMVYPLPFDKSTSLKPPQKGGEQATTLAPTHPSSMMVDRIKHQLPNKAQLNNAHPLRLEPDGKQQQPMICDDGMMHRLVAMITPPPKTTTKTQADDGYDVDSKNASEESQRNSKDDRKTGLDALRDDDHDDHVNDSSLKLKHNNSSSTKNDDDDDDEKKPSDNKGCATTLSPTSTTNVPTTAPPEKINTSSFTQDIKSNDNNTNSLGGGGISILKESVLLTEQKSSPAAAAASVERTTSTSKSYCMVEIPNDAKVGDRFLVTVNDPCNGQKNKHFSISCPLLDEKEKVMMDNKDSRSGGGNTRKQHYTKICVVIPPWYGEEEGKDETTKIEETHQQQQKKKRGRPRKIQSSDDINNNEELLPKKKKRGRPRKIIQQQQEVGVSEEEEPPNKKKRDGRPCKTNDQKEYDVNKKRYYWRVEEHSSSKTTPTKSENSSSSLALSTTTKVQPPWENCIAGDGGVAVKSENGNDETPPLSALGMELQRCIADEAKNYDNSDTTPHPPADTTELQRRITNEVKDDDDDDDNNVTPLPADDTDITDILWWQRPSPSLWKIHSVDMDVAVKKIKMFLPKGVKACAEEVGHFFLYCHERQCMWERRQSGDSDAPYSTNNTLGMLSFCNNYRELDRGTCYFRSNMLDLWDNQLQQPDQKKWIELVLWSSVVYRIVNKVETFMDLGGIPSVENWNAFSYRLKSLSQSKTKKVFTGAHQNPGIRRYCEAIVALKKSLQERAERLFLACARQSSRGDNGLKKCFSIINEIPHTGRFFAWQVTCDLLEAGCLAPCTDNDWTELGPGAENGINIIFDQSKRDDLNKLDLTRMLEQEQEKVFEALGVEFPRLAGMRLSMKSIEHGLCEFTKYMALQPILSKKQKPKGHRFRKSRSYLDVDKKCPCGIEDDVIFCDFCLGAYCLSCVTPPSTSWFKCHRCQKFESFTWPDDDNNIKEESNHARIDYSDHHLRPEWTKAMMVGARYKFFWSKRYGWCECTVTEMPTETDDGLYVVLQFDDDGNETRRLKIRSCEKSRWRFIK